MNERFCKLGYAVVYASVEKVEAPHLEDVPLIVSGDPERRSGVVLAACPLAKKRGVQNASRLWEAQEKCPEAVVVRPRMQRYLDVSVMMTELLEQYTDPSRTRIHLMNSFSMITGSVTTTRFASARNAENIQTTIMNQTGIYARIGIGPNKVLAKMACDHFAKQNKSGIYELRADRVAADLWPLPIGKLFGVGKRMEHHLKRMGISTIGTLATYPLDRLQKRWGINGELLQRTALGHDPSPVTLHTHDQQKSRWASYDLPMIMRLLRTSKSPLLN